MQLGTALGIASASVVFFQYAPAGSRGATATDAFAGSVRYVFAALAVMWALMLRLPKAVTRLRPDPLPGHVRRRTRRLWLARIGNA
ncbi:hypothetical protein [Streptomyces vinaceus]|uniref:hypothetical protein n=1 Tax=Streptomyces vinaceus TaxID=1960 RepID=UPI0036B70058